MGTSYANASSHEGSAYDLSSHLQMVQGVIARMAQNAFAVKTWSVTIMAAVFAFAPADTTARAGLWLVLVPATAFWWLDAYYLRQERLFRALYSKILEGSVPAYSMDTKPYSSVAGGMTSAGFAAAVWPVHAVALLAMVLKAAVAQGLVTWR
jgi:hypothetical protein